MLSNSKHLQLSEIHPAQLLHKSIKDLVLCKKVYTWRINASKTHHDHLTTQRYVSYLDFESNSHCCNDSALCTHSHFLNFSHIHISTLPRLCLPFTLPELSAHLHTSILNWYSMICTCSSKMCCSRQVFLNTNICSKLRRHIDNLPTILEGNKSQWYFTKLYNSVLPIPLLLQSNSPTLLSSDATWHVLLCSDKSAFGVTPSCQKFN